VIRFHRDARSGGIVLGAYADRYGRRQALSRRATLSIVVDGSTLSSVRPTETIMATKENSARNMSCS
jgi:hypothetical protein